MQEDNKYLFNKRLKIPIYTAFFTCGTNFMLRKFMDFHFHSSLSFEHQHHLAYI